MAMNEPLKTNDQVYRDAASVVPTSATENGGSGSTHCSPSETTDVTITFTGKVASGKSTIAELVYDFLKSQGINCELRDHDHPDRQADLEKRVDAVKRRGTKFIVLAANWASYVA